jgi:hypothetical protein
MDLQQRRLTGLQPNDIASEVAGRLFPTSVVPDQQDRTLSCRCHSLQHLRLAQHSRPPPAVSIDRGSFLRRVSYQVGAPADEVWSARRAQLWCKGYPRTHHARSVNSSAAAGSAWWLPTPDSHYASGSVAWATPAEKVGLHSTKRCLRADHCLQRFLGACGVTDPSPAKEPSVRPPPRSLRYIFPGRLRYSTRPHLHRMSVGSQPSPLSTSAHCAATLRPSSVRVRS